MPPIKELNFFSNRALLKNDEARLEYLQTKRDNLSQKLLKDKKHDIVLPEVPKVATLDNAIDWYKSLFTLGYDQGLNMTGDISPLYQNLTQEMILVIKKEFPDIKIIYVLRNPVERLWSDFNMENERLFKLPIESTSPEHLLDVILSRTVRGGFVYQVYKQWKDIFGDNMLTLFFEELKQDPVNFTKEINGFLGLKNKENLAKNTNNPNPRKKFPMPQYVNTNLCKLLHGDVKALHSEFNNTYTSQYLSYIEDHIK